MTQYIFVYKSNEAFDWSSQSREEVKRIVDAWGSWVGSMGPARKGGSAFKFGGTSVTKDGKKKADNLLTGYAIVEAKDFDEALEMAQNAPNVISGEGSIEVYEAFAVRDN